MRGPNSPFLLTGFFRRRAYLRTQDDEGDNGSDTSGPTEASRSRKVPRQGLASLAKEATLEKFDHMLLGADEDERPPSPPTPGISHPSKMAVAPRTNGKPRGPPRLLFPKARIRPFQRRTEKLPSFLTRQEAPWTVMMTLTTIGWPPPMTTHPHQGSSSASSIQPPLPPLARRKLVSCA